MVVGASRAYWRPCELTRILLDQVFTPSIGWVNNCDGGRSHTYCDYRQA